MTALLEKVTHEALELPERERARLAHSLIVSIDSVDDAEHSAAWDAEIEKRVTDIRTNRVEGIPAETVFSKLKAKYH